MYELCSYALQWTNFPLFISPAVQGNRDPHLIEWVLNSWIFKSLRLEGGIDPLNRFCTAQPRDRQTEQLTDTPRYEITGHNIPHYARCVFDAA